MARSFKISITDGLTTVWLTSDGLEDGRPCRTQIAGVAALYEPVSGNTTVAAGGVPFTEKPLTNGGGKPFDILIPNCPTARYEALESLKNSLVAAGGLATIHLEGEPGTVDVDAIPRFDPIPLDFESQFNTDNMRGVLFRFTTAPS
jgi:hypothetical protein